MQGRRWRMLAAPACAALTFLVLQPMTANAVVDTTPPNPPTITGPSGRVASTSAGISVTRADPSDTVQCFVDGEEVNCPGSWTITGLVEGPHAVTATAYDAANNASKTVYVSWVVDTVGPIGTMIAPNGLSNPATVSFDEDVAGTTAPSVRLVTDAGSPVATTRSCITNTLEPTPCSATNVRKVRLTPEEGWVLGERYRVLVNPGGSATVADDLGNVATATDAPFRVQTWTEELGATYTWRPVSNVNARGGSYLVEHRRGASATWTFSGGSLTWVTMTGPSHGKAEVYIDGTLRGSYNNYSRRTQFGVKRTLTGLGSGNHTVEVRALGKKGARAGTGTLVAVDGFVTEGGSVATPVVSQAWQRIANAGASNGYYAVADLAGQTATLQFRGTSVTLDTVRGPRFGNVALYVDGDLATTADLYASSVTYGHQVTVSNLPDARHTLEVRVLGTSSPASTGTGVVVDRISVA